MEASEEEEEEEEEAETIDIEELMLGLEDNDNDVKDDESDNDHSSSMHIQWSLESAWERNASLVTSLQNQGPLMASGLQCRNRQRRRSMVVYDVLGKPGCSSRRLEDWMWAHDCEPVVGGNEFEGSSGTYATAAEAVVEEGAQLYCSLQLSAKEDPGGVKAEKRWSESRSNFIAGMSTTSVKGNEEDEEEEDCLLVGGGGGSGTVVPARPFYSSSPSSPMPEDRGHHGLLRRWLVRVSKLERDDDGSSRKAVAGAGSSFRSLVFGKGLRAKSSSSFSSSSSSLLSSASSASSSWLAVSKRRSMVKPSVMDMNLRAWHSFSDARRRSLEEEMMMVMQEEEKAMVGGGTSSEAGRGLESEEEEGGSHWGVTLYTTSERADESDAYDECVAARGILTSLVGASVVNEKSISLHPEHEVELKQALRLLGRGSTLNTAAAVAEEEVLVLVPTVCVKGKAQTYVVGIDNIMRLYKKGALGSLLLDAFPSTLTRDSLCTCRGGRFLICPLCKGKGTLTHRKRGHAPAPSRSCRHCIGTGLLKCPNCLFSSSSR